MCLKGHLCRFEDLPICLSSYENNRLKNYLLLFEICGREICERFVYKHLEAIE